MTANFDKKGKRKKETTKTKKELPEAASAPGKGTTKHEGRPVTARLVRKKDALLCFHWLFNQT